jgi:hypothetical protein
MTAIKKEVKQDISPGLSVTQNKFAEFAESGQPNEQTTRQVDVCLASREDAAPCQVVNNE